MSTRGRSTAYGVRADAALSLRDIERSPYVRRSLVVTPATGRAPSRTATRPSTADGLLRRSLGQTDHLESEYIKNLQQQIYFLELEVNFLKEQNKKKETVSRQVPLKTAQTHKWTEEIETLKHQLHNYQGELSRRTSAVDRLTSERQQLLHKLDLSKEPFQREKETLIEEIVSLKKKAESHNRQMSVHAEATRKLKQESTKSYTSLVEAEKKQKILRDQLEHRASSQKELRLEVERKRTEVTQLQTQIQELEHRFLGSDTAKQDTEIRDIQEDMRQLRLQLKQTEVEADQDRYMKTKMAEDCSALVKENALLSSQVAEFQKQIDRERSHRNAKEERRSASIKELVELREQNKEKDKELTKLQSMLHVEQSKLQDALTRLSEQERVTLETQSNATSLDKELRDLERLHREQDQENITLRRDKVLLVDHVSDLQQKIEYMDEEIGQLTGELTQLRSRVTEMTSKARLQKSLEALKWEEFEKMADAVKTETSERQTIMSSHAENN